MLPECSNIIFDIDVLCKKLEENRNEGKKIVFTNGCYDILHPGHVHLLSESKALGDILVLGLNTDDSVRRQNKGIERPIISLPARAFVVAHLSSVDYVTSFDEDTPYRLIERIQPDILVKGGDWSIENIVGADIVQARGGSVHNIALVEGYSTTAIVNRCKNNI